MAADDAVDENARAAQQSQITFEGYFTGLAFTVLGFALQTARFSCPIPDALELVGWGLLLVAGLAGLYRAQYMPNLFGVFAQRNRYDAEAADLRQKMHEGMEAVLIAAEKRTVAASDLLKNKEEMVEAAKEVSKGLEKKTSRAFAIRRFSFVAGMISLILSRGFFPAMRIGALAVPAMGVWQSCP